MNKSCVNFPLCVCVCGGGGVADPEAAYNLRFILKIMSYDCNTTVLATAFTYIHKYNNTFHDSLT
jgi:hypothetical protein